MRDASHFYWYKSNYFFPGIKRFYNIVTVAGNNNCLIIKFPLMILGSWLILILLDIAYK